MNRSMLGTYWTIWSQQKPVLVCGKIVVGSRRVKLAPPFVEWAAIEFTVTNTTFPAAAPLGSLTSAAGWPSFAFVRKLIPACALRAPCCVRSPCATRGAVAFGRGGGLRNLPIGVAHGAVSFTSEPKTGFLRGNF